MKKYIQIAILICLLILIAKYLFNVDLYDYALDYIYNDCPSPPLIVGPRGTTAGRTEAKVENNLANDDISEEDIVDLTKSELDDDNSIVDSFNPPEVEDSYYNSESANEANEANDDGINDYTDEYKVQQHYEKSARLLPSRKEIKNDYQPFNRNTPKYMPF